MLKTYTSMKMLGSLMLIAIGITVGCGETSEVAMEESKQAQTAAPEHEESPCASDPGHHECLDIGEDEIVAWQDDYEDPSWRTNSTREEDGMSVVDFDARALNTGLIPTEAGQGHYDSEEDLLQTIEELLGEPAESSGFSSVAGDWTKLDNDWEEDKGSSGEFVWDALSDEDGNIYIDGRPIDAYLEAEMGMDTEMVGLQNSPPSQTTLGDSQGDEYATLKVFTTNLYFYWSIGSKLEDYYLDGETSERSFTCGWTFPPCWWRTDAVNASSMSLTNVFSHYDSRTTASTQLYVIEEQENNTDSLSNRMWSAGISVCTGDCYAVNPDAPDLPVNQVCAVGLLDGEYDWYTGTVGTSHGC